MVAFASRCLLLLTAFALPSLLECKVQTGSFQLGNTLSDDQRWHFASKFGYGIGAGQYRIRARLRGDAAKFEHPRLDFHVFLDEDWEKASSSLSCSSKASAARRTQSLHLKKNDEWGSWTVGTLSQKVRPHIWYFAMSTCDQDFGDIELSIDFEIQMKQVDLSEFSFEMRWMLAWSCCSLICLTFFGMHYSSRCYNFAINVGGLHPVIWVLSAAIGLQYLAQVFHLLHLWRYRSDGIGIISADTLSEVMSMLSQVVVTTLLIALAMGYTLLSSRSGQMTIVKYIAVYSLALHAALVSFGKLQDESHCKYHENEGAVGWVLLSVRLMLFAWFFFAAQALSEKGGPRLHDFLNQFRFAGSVYFLAFPVLFIVVQFFAPYLQHPIMQIGVLTMQTLSNAWLADLFLSKGVYFKVSALSSPLLPAYGLCSLDKSS